jgi:hypothetical protein
MVEKPHHSRRKGALDRRWQKSSRTDLGDEEHRDRDAFQREYLKELTSS